MMWVRQCPHFIIFFHTGAIFCFFPVVLMSSTCTDRNNTCFFDERNIHSQFGTLSHPSSIGISLNIFPTAIQLMGVHVNFVQEKTTGSSIFPHDFGHFCRGRRIPTSGHSDFGNFEQSRSVLQFYLSKTGTASAACPSQSGNLAITSITVAAVICDADDLCSEKSA